MALGKRQKQHLDYLWSQVGAGESLKVTMDTRELKRRKDGTYPVVVEFYRINEVKTPYARVEVARGCMLNRQKVDEVATYLAALKNREFGQ